MKRQAKILSVILSSVLLLSMTTPVTAFAAEEAIVRKDRAERYYGISVQHGKHRNAELRFHKFHARYALHQHR